MFHLIPVVRPIAAIFDRLKSAARHIARGPWRCVELLESIHDGFVTLDRESRFTYVNHGAEVLMGKPRAELLGKKAWEVFPELSGTIVEDNCRRAVGEHKPIHFEYHHAASNTWVAVEVSPTKGGGVSVGLRDITDEREAQRARREKEERYRFTLEAANVGTWDWNIATGENSWSQNMELMHRMPPGSFRGMIEDALQTVYPEDRDPMRERIAHAIESGDPYEMEYRVAGPDGKVAWLNSKGRVIYDPGTGKPERMIGITTDITDRKAAETALRDSEARFRTLARHAPVGIFQLDRNGSCVFVNEHWSIRAGQTTEQALEYGWLNAVHPEDRDQVLKTRTKAIAEGQPYAVSYRIPLPDGKMLWVDTFAVPIRNNEGEVTGFVGTTVDVTEHKLWENELERANKQVKDILESITEMFIAVDRDWRFIYANRSAVERIRRPLHEILGKNVWEFFPELVATEFHAQLQRVMTERVAAHFEFMALDGSWLDVHAQPSSEGLSIYTLDVTERKRNEEELSRLASVVDASDDAIVSFSLDGAVLTWNGGAEKLFGYSAQEMIGQKMDRMRPPELMAESEQKLAGVKYGKAFQHYRTRRVRKDGRSIWVSITASPIRDRRGEIVGISSTARDITETTALEEQLQQTAKLESLGVLAGGIAHDFNNLLVGILGNASLVRNALPLDSQEGAMLDDVISASERAAALTRQLLAYSGRGKFVIQPVDISSLVQEMTKLVGASVPKTVGVRLQLASHLPPVVADVAQIQQLIMNLVINAAEAVGDHPGRVTVTTGEQEILEGQADVTPVGADPIVPGRYVFFEVKDDGAGMDEATVAKIFDPFFTTKFTGRGLGLSAALGIVRSHEGFIQVTSSPGRGSTFKVLVPAAHQRAAPPDRELPVPGTKEDLHGSGVILLVDDEEIVRRTAAATLSSLGYTIIEASDGREAIDLFQRNLHRISLVILDLSMPVMNGEECLRLLKRIKPGVPVLLSSGFAEAEAARRFQSTGAACFLQKPYTAQHLAELAKATMLKGTDTPLRRTA